MSRSRGTRRWPPRPVPAALSVLLFFGLVLLPTAASAHSVLLSSTPASSATVPSAPATVQLDFNERPHGRFSVVHVLGPDGARRDGGTLSVVDDTVTQPLTGTRPAGTYTVDWRVVSADGHPVSGQWRFTAAAAAPPLAQPAVVAGKGSATTNGASSDAGQHLGHLLLGVGVAVLIGIATVVERLVARRRRVHP